MLTLSSRSSGFATRRLPEYLSLEYVELHRAVAEVVDRDPHGYAADLAARLLTRVVVNLEQPLIPSDEEPSLAADLLDGPEQGRLHRAEFYGSLDGGPWRLVRQLACQPGVTGTRWNGGRRGACLERTRELPTQVYGVYRKRELVRSSRAPRTSSTPAGWMRAVLDLPARAHDFELRLEFSVGPFVDETGRRRWPEAPALHQGYLEDQRGSLDFSRLSELSEAFEKPRASWPTPDLRVLAADIVHTPLVPNAGDTVSVEFTVRNVGAQDVRAMIEFWLDASGVEREERLDFVADVPAGRYYRLMRSIKMPHGSATGFAGIQAQLAPPRGSIKRIEESNRNNNDAVRPLGERPAGVP